MTHAPLYELQLLCPRAAAALTTDALWALDALSVTSEDANAGTAAEDALFGEPGLPSPATAWTQTRLRALFASQQQAQHAAQLMALQDFFAQGQIERMAPVPQQDWVQQTQAQFASICIAPGFWIVPSWRTAPKDARHIIRLDPGQSFGTGTHPTTRMCLRWIHTHAPVGPRVLDYGCGSGILAIAAALHGAPRVTAVDIDPTAVDVTQANASQNDVTLQAGLPERAQGQYDLVIANILAAPLKTLAPTLAQRLAPGGHLLLSGLLQTQADALQQTYAPWLALDVADDDEGWILLAGTLPAA